MNAGETYIIFELGDSSYGLRSADVMHIDMLEHITSVPHTATAVEGVVFSRGQLIPALDLRTRFGFPRVPPTPRTRLIFIRVLQRTIALIVDAAREFRTIPLESIRPIAETLHGVKGNYVQGVATVGDRLVLLLDVDAVLKLDDATALFSAASPVLQSAH